MIVCPVCEHAQPGGLECEMCGRPLTAPAQADLGEPMLEGLEPTLLGDAGPPAAEEAFPDLEPTGHAPVPAPARSGDDLLAELEPTRSAPTAAPAPDAVPDMERLAGPMPDEERTPFPALVTCRYCGTEGGLGERLCGRCGMRLPVPDAFPAAALEEEGARCGCGMVVTGSRCPACGARRT
jgi:hypothetical protein